MYCPHCCSLNDFSYTCYCHSGYTKKGRNCVPDCDENQCSLASTSCPANSACRDLCEGFECRCNEGYSMQNGKCVPKKNRCDANQCLLKHSCPANSNCSDLCEGFECVCNAGLAMIDGKCLDASRYGQGPTDPPCDEDQDRVRQNLNFFNRVKIHDSLIFLVLTI